MGDPLLQKLLQLRSTDAILERIDNWLTAFFEDQLLSGPSSEKALLSMLDMVRKYTQTTKVGHILPMIVGFPLTMNQILPPAVLRYLQTMLLEWNGTAGREVVMDLLTYIPLEPFEGTSNIFVIIYNNSLNSFRTPRLSLSTPRMGHS
jgi:centromere protein I